MRLGDLDALLEKQECLFMKGHILFHGVTAYTIESFPTIDPETLPIVQELREKLKRVTEERDAALKQLSDISDCDTKHTGCIPRGGRGKCKWEWNGGEGGHS